MSYHFHARNAHFFIAAAADFEQQILDLLLEAKPHAFDCVIVAQCRSSDGHHIEASALSKSRQLKVTLPTTLHEYIIRGDDDKEEVSNADKKKKKVQTVEFDDDEVDNHHVAEQKKRPKPKPKDRVVALKYEVYLRFKSSPGIRDREWGYNLLDCSPEHSSLIAAVSVPMPVSDDEVVVDLMQREAKAIFGKPVLTRKAVLLLLNRQFASQRDNARDGSPIDEDQMRSIVACARNYYSEGDNTTAVERLIKEWQTANNIPITSAARSSRPARLQEERAFPG
jgi:hypothetical protein